MPVSINMPQRQQQADPLEKLATALQIAKTGFGIAADLKTLEEAKATKAAETKLRESQQKKLDREEGEAAEDNNPNSPIMASIRETAKRRGLILPEGMTPKQARTSFDAFLKPKEEKVKDPLAVEMAQVRLEEAKAKKGEREEKKQTLVREVEDRRQNIKDAIGILKKKIGEDGTWELLGSHNQDIDRIVDGIATDMAKLQDPQSVARPSEVDLVKSNLIQSGFKNANSTAADILDNFATEVDRRADTAYKVRGLEIPAMAKQQLSDEDKAALKWAQSNSKDPRALEILKANGIELGTAGR
jgi:hypothetical protein